MVGRKDEFPGGGIFVGPMLYIAYRRRGSFHRASRHVRVQPRRTAAVLARPAGVSGEWKACC